MTPLISHFRALSSRCMMIPHPSWDGVSSSCRHRSPPVHLLDVISACKLQRCVRALLHSSSRASPVSNSMRQWQYRPLPPSTSAHWRTPQSERLLGHTPPARDVLPICSVLRSDTQDQDRNKALVSPPMFPAGSLGVLGSRWVFARRCLLGHGCSVLVYLYRARSERRLVEE